MIDGAPYHRSIATREYLARQRIKVVMSGAYSYDGSPIEMLFALLKRVNLNPDG